MHRLTLLNLLADYRRNSHSSFMDEAAYINRAVNFIKTHENCFYREQWPMHITASAWVVSPDRERVLMLHHKKLNRWFQPGGHADGDENVIRVALKETHEETGIDEKYIHLVDEKIFDVDIHTIPAMANDPEHEHIDIRFLIEIDDEINVPGNAESHQIRWLSLFDVSRFNNNRSTYRMVEKTRRMRFPFSNKKTA